MVLLWGKDNGAQFEDKAPCSLYAPFPACAHKLLEVPKRM